MTSLRGRAVRSVLAAVVSFVLAAPPQVLALASAPGKSGKAPCAGVDVAAAARHWQEKLRLQDWEILVECKMPERYWKSNLGISASNTATRAAIVWVHPEIRNPALVSEVVLHEMLHVLLYHVKKAESAEIDEQVVRTITKVIMGPNAVPEEEKSLP